MRLTTSGCVLHSVISMNTRLSLPWLVILGLGIFALVRPLTRIIASQFDILVPSAVPLVLTAAITVVWVAVVGLRRDVAPVLTLVLAGVTYAVLSIVLSAVLSPILDGQLAGPLARPVAILPFVLFNAGWGLVAGFLALLLQRIRSTS